MSKFRPDYFDYIKFNRVYYTPVVENVFDSVYKSQFETVKSQVTKGIININTRKSLFVESNDKGQTLLHYALLYNQIKIAEFLISQGADLKAKDNSGQKVINLMMKNVHIYLKICITILYLL